MGADVRVDDDQGPETDQGQGVAVEGASRGDGQHVIGDRQGQRGQQESENVMAVEPEDNGIRNPDKGAAARFPNDIADAIGTGCQHHSGADIPDRHIENRLFSPHDGHQKIDDGHENMVGAETPPPYS